MIWWLVCFRFPVCVWFDWICIYLPGDLLWWCPYLHRWVLPVLGYPRNMVIYHYPPIGVIYMVILHVFIIKNDPNCVSRLINWENIRIIFDHKNLQHYHKNYPNWRVMVNYHISRVMENGSCLSMLARQYSMRLVVIPLIK